MSLAAASAFDDDGIQVRFLNSRVEGNGLRSEGDALGLVSQIRFSGMTPLGTSLDQKILQPLILGPARAGQLKKPVLVIAVTDGQPGGEPRDTLARVLINASRSLQQTRYGADALSVTLAQVRPSPTRSRTDRRAALTLRLLPHLLAPADRQRPARAPVPLRARRAPRGRRPDRRASLSRACARRRCISSS